MDTNPATPQSDSYSVEVHGLIAKEHPKEYVEAVISSAMKIMTTYQHRDDTLVVINPRRIVVILHARSHRGKVIPVDFVEQVVEGTMKLKLTEWLKSPPTPFYVMHIAGNWLTDV